MSTPSSQIPDELDFDVECALREGCLWGGCTRSGGGCQGPPEDTADVQTAGSSPDPNRPITPPPWATDRP